MTDPLKSGASLLSSIDAAKNTRALFLLMATFAAGVLVFAMGFALARFSWFLLFTFGLLAYGVLFYGSNAVGVMLMDEAEGLPSRSIGAAIAASLFSAHRLLLLMLLLALVYAVGFMALALVLFICKVPGIGPVLYAVVFPLSALVTGIAYFAVPMVVLPLSAPAIWKGAGVMEALSHLMGIVRTRLLTVALQMFGVAFLAGVVAFIVFGILLTGSLTTGAMSVPLLGVGGDVMGLFTNMMGGLFGGYGGGRMGGGASGYLVAAGVGGGLLFAAGMTLPGLVYLKGACIVYLQAIDGVDLVAERARVQEMMEQAKRKMEEAKEKARQVQQQAEETARQAREANRAREAEKLRQQQEAAATAVAAAAVVAPAPAAQPAPTPYVAATPLVTPAAAADVGVTLSRKDEPLDLDLGYEKTEAIRPLAVAEPVLEPGKLAEPPVAVAAQATPPVDATPNAPTTHVSLPECPKCHAEVAHDDVFCGQCGFKLK